MPAQVFSGTPVDSATSAVSLCDAPTQRALQNLQNLSDSQWAGTGAPVALGLGSHVFVRLLHWSQVMENITTQILIDIRDEVRKTNSELSATRKELSGAIAKTNGELVSTRKELKGEIAKTNARLDQTNARLDQTNARLDQTNARLEQNSTRLDNVHTSHNNLFAHVVESDLRRDGKLAEIALDVETMKHQIIDHFDLTDRVERCESEIDKIKDRLQ